VNIREIITCDILKRRKNNDRLKMKIVVLLYFYYVGFKTIENSLSAFEKLADDFRRK